MADKSFALVFENTARAAESVPLKPGDFLIGRSRTNGIVLEDPLVSRTHIRITVSGDDVVAEDLESSHGTFLNDKRVRGKISLNNGDVLQLGDVKLRFVAAGKPESDECTSFVDSPEPAPTPSRATECAPAPAPAAAPVQTRGPSDGETRFMAPQKPPDENDLDKTRVIGDGETRLMDASEFKGLKAAPRQPIPRNKLLPVAVLAGMLVVIGLVWLFTREDGPGGASGTGISRTDESHGIAISAPAGWRLTQGGKGALFGFESRIRGSDKSATVDVYADRGQDYGITGLQVAFEAYLEMISARVPGMTLQGRKVMSLNNATGVFYAFASPGRSGKGFFLLSGNKRICAECACPPDCSDLLATVFPGILRSIRLTEPQQFIDFPPPTEALRRIALSSRDHLAAMSKRDLDAGNSLLKNRDVRPENLYLAHRTFQSCMTSASALGDKPPFYAEAAARLAESTRALAAALVAQKLRIVIAEQKRDVDQVYWESVKLAQMMPDKTSDYYQFASKRIDFYSKLRDKD